MKNEEVENKNLIDADIDRRKLHQELSKVYGRIIELRKGGVKKGLRGWGCNGRKHLWEKYVEINKVYNKPNMIEAEFEYLCCRMTILCTIRNLARGKFHADTLIKSHDRYITINEPGGKYGSYPIEEMTLKDQMVLIGDEWKEFVYQPVVAIAAE
jgi:hypothetical protein